MINKRCVHSFLVIFVKRQLSIFFFCSTFSAKVKQCCSLPKYQTPKIHLNRFQICLGCFNQVFLTCFFMDSFLVLLFHVPVGVIHVFACFETSSRRPTSLC